MLAKFFSIIRNYVLSVSSQRKYNFYHQNTLLDAFRTNSRNIIGRNPSMVIPLLANQDLTPMLNRLNLLHWDINLACLLINAFHGYSQKYSGPVYTIPFSYENGMEMLSYENGIV